MLPAFANPAARRIRVTLFFQSPFTVMFLPPISKSPTVGRLIMISKIKTTPEMLIKGRKEVIGDAKAVATVIGWANLQQHQRRKGFHSIISSCSFDENLQNG